VEWAGTAFRSEATFFIAKFNQPRRRGLDYRRAPVVTAHNLIVVIHRVLCENLPFQDLRAAYFEQPISRSIRNLTRRIETLGSAATLSNFMIESEQLQ
jgi:hypothetical protein